MKLRTLLLLFVLTTIAGCGTVFNLTDKNPAPYGGVRHDLTYLDNLQEVKGPGTGQLFQNGVYDLAATCVLDTVTLPFVLVRVAVTGYTQKGIPADDHGYLSRTHQGGVSRSDGDEALPTEHR